jgi:hypothetical protein
VHQAYGRDYQLPNLSAYNETCATIGYALWNWRMLEATGDAQYADLLERSLYNGILPAIDLQGTHYFYVNALRKYHDMTFPMRWSRVREDYISSFCCPPNVVRMIAEAQNYAYSLSQDALWVHLYGANELETEWIDGGKIKLRQQTDYPWDGTIKFEIESAPARPIAIRLRIPGWSGRSGNALTVNGNPEEGSLRPGTYFEVRRTWRSGDTIELKLMMTPQILEANPMVEETLNQAAVQRGPLVYCLESNELPEGVKIQNVALGNDMQHRQFTIRRQMIGEREVVALELPALDLDRPEWKSDQLYRGIVTSPPKEIRMRLVPYYAWGNRGDTEMTVWLPVK